MGDEVSFCKRRNDIRENRGGPKAGENKRVRRGEHFVIGVKKRQSKKRRRRWRFRGGRDGKRVRGKEREM